jgi:uncharacterized protein YabE (DUF348 family)
LRAWPVVTVVCLVLLALLTVVPVAVAAAIIVLVQVETRAPVLETHTVTRYWHPQLFTRPPPMACQGFFA